MPKIRRERIPRALIFHLLDRIQERSITEEQLLAVLAWMETEPVVPIGSWFKRFPGVIVCGHGELVKTFLRMDQTPIGSEMF
jgi:hypothetical protein